MVKVAGPSITATVRAFLDMGSQMSCVTESLVQLLGLRRRTLSGGCTGIGQTPVAIHGMVQMDVTSLDGSHSFQVNAAILTRITRNLPTDAVGVSDWKHLANLKLADPDFHVPGPISILLGAEIIGLLMEKGFIRGGRDAPHAFCTKLGWILFGSVSLNRSLAMEPDQTVATALVEPAATHERNALDLGIRKLWELQEPLQASILTPEEQECERLFDSTHVCDATGKYVVRIPFKQDPSVLGDSRQQALHHFHRLEKRLLQSPAVASQYIDFMAKYESLGHMRLAPGPPQTASRVYYITHHAVLSKFRVVFNASLATRNGPSLNDIQLTGPMLQRTLWQQLLQFQLYRIALSADIEKMFRMVGVHEDDLDLQRIFWRAKPTHKLLEYQLLTVTYGMRSASYNAVKAMIQCGKDQAGEFPLAAHAIQNNFYMDDFLASYDSAEEALAVKRQLDTALRRRNFTLRKWRSNDWYVLGECVDVEHGDVSLEMDQAASVLGLKWQAQEDHFRFDVRAIEPAVEKYTKRVMASEIARVFDPTGFLSPVTIVGKILIQRLWLVKCGWDEAVPPAIQISWVKHRQQLEMLSQLEISRWKGVRVGVPTEIHYFCDASQDAYAAVCYTRSIGSDGEIDIRLLTSKAKVAPLNTVSIPRLELCAAEMAAVLHRDIGNTWQIPIDKVTFWTDSQVVLAWLQTVPRTMHTYVANRVSHILALTKPDQWRHIRGEQNPADCASRGMPPSEFVQHTLWWNGPNILRQDPHRNASTPSELSEGELNAYRAETKNPLISLNMADSPPPTVLEVSGESLLDRTNSLYKLLRATAYVFRFGNSSRRNGHITLEEMRHSLEYWIKCEQSQAFYVEIACCRRERPIPRSSVLRDYGVILDNHGLLRIKGRLQNAPLAADTRHPLVIPAKSQLAKLLILDAHRITLHGGTQVVLSHLRLRYWIVHARSYIKRLRHLCVTCKRHRPTLLTQQMADLPAARVNPNPPFHVCGVDYFGPITIRVGHTRSKTRAKGYVAVFVCMVTRAIHLECAEDLSTEKFIDALQRFMSRRGVCKEIWSDNGTNFHGASNCWLQAIRSDSIPSYLSTVETSWKFITPNSPWQGGLWESAVRLTKHHLKRVLGNATLSSFELQHILIRIEGVLNSRPMVTVRDDPNNDAIVLTPAHFLIGRSLLAPPEALDDLKGLRTRYAQRQQILRDFWRAWSHDYLFELQRRNKWQDERPNVNIGDVVAIQNENLPPAHWAIGRITELHPGKDKLVRNVTLRTANGIIQRPIQRLCPLPVDS